MTLHTSTVHRTDRPNHSVVDYPRTTAYLIFVVAFIALIALL